MTEKHKIALVTDSTSDIPANLREQYDIHMVPLYVIWGQEELRDGVDITYQSFYERLPKDPVHPTTSQPTPHDFEKLFTELKAGGAEEVVVIAISDKLSGTLDSVRTASGMVDIPVHEFDSRSISMGLGWQVIAAARAREAGGSAADMIKAADEVRKSTAVIFTVDTLDYLHKGGRIGAAAKLLGTALQLKPQLLINPEIGIVEAGEKVRTRKKALEAVYGAFFSKMNSGPLHLTVMHIAAEDEAKLLAERIKAEHQPAEIFITDTSPVIGVHGGPGTVGIVGYSGT